MENGNELETKRERERRCMGDQNKGEAQWMMKRMNFRATSSIVHDQKEIVGNADQEENREF